METCERPGYVADSGSCAARPAKQKRVSKGRIQGKESAPARLRRERRSKQAEPLPDQASDAQYRLLRRRLVTGALPPGTLLLETSIATENGVSRTPVRDALARLEQDGFVRRAPRGYRVRERTPEEVIDVYNVRISLEALAASLAAERHTLFDLTRLQQIHSESQTCHDPGRLAELSVAFHSTVSTAAHNVTLEETLGRLNGLMAVYGARGFNHPESNDLIQREHGALLDAIEKRDSDRAQAEATTHLHRVRDTRVKAMLEDSRPTGA